MRQPKKPADSFGRGKPPFNPRTGTYEPLADVGTMRRLTIVQVGYDVLVCKDAEDVQTLVARPDGLRRTDYDGQTIGGVDYTHTALDERLASDGVNPDEDQFVTPGYFEGQAVLVVKLHEKDRVQATVWDELTDYGASEEYVLDWMESGRREWAVESAGGGGG